MQSLPPKNLGAELVDAASAGWLKQVRQLIKDGADVHFRKDQALVSAGSNGHADVVAFLLKHGAHADADAGAPLQHAVSRNQVAVVKLLLKHKANVDTCGGQPLISAATLGTADMLQALLEGGANVHVSGDLPLLRALHNGGVAEVSLLLAYGADPFASGATAQLLARNDGGVELISILGKAMRKQKEFFLSQLDAALDKKGFLSSFYKDMNGYQTYDRTLVRALKMGCLTEALDAMTSGGQYLTQDMVKASRDFTSKQLLLIAGDATQHQGQLKKIFDPKVWGGKIDDMTAMWEEFFTSLPHIHRNKLDFQPEDMGSAIAAHRLQMMKANAPRLMAPRPPGRF